MGGITWRNRLAVLVFLIVLFLGPVLADALLGVVAAR
jgi:hypothetical protein